MRCANQKHATPGRDHILKVAVWEQSKLINKKHTTKKTPPKEHFSKTDVSREKYQETFTMKHTYRILQRQLFFFPWLTYSICWVANDCTENQSSPCGLGKLFTFVSYVYKQRNLWHQQQLAQIPLQPLRAPGGAHISPTTFLTEGPCWLLPAGF